MRVSAVERAGACESAAGLRGSAGELGAVCGSEGECVGVRRILWGAWLGKTVEGLTKTVFSLCCWFK